MAKTTQRGTTASTSPRASAKRGLVRTPDASAYAKRSASGQFREMDDVGRSQRADRTRAATTTVTAGYGDQGDQTRRPVKRASKKR